jgi:hypothetical protein
VCEESENRSLFIDVPNDDTLIIGSTDEGLSIFGDRESPDPSFMSGEGLLAVSSIDFPKSDGFIPRAGEDKVTLWVEVYIRNVVIVPIECFKAEVVIIDVPELDGEIGGAGGEVAALLVVVDVIDRI